jgi:methionyl-tRNA formyltransferase
VNGDDCLKLLQKIDPDVIVVNGTRIISKRVLTSTRSIFINTHAGITPQYRGVFGAYWALVSNDAINCGVTIHQVDAGIDTGAIISQKITPVDKEDCFITYPMHQYGAATGLMKEAVQQFLQAGTLKGRPARPGAPSKLWYHPTLTFYLYHRIFRGIK